MLALFRTARCAKAGSARPNARKSAAVSARAAMRRRIFHPVIIVLVTRAFQALMVLSAFAAAVMPIDSTTIENAYSVSIYPKIQALVTPVSNLAPFALFDVLTVGAAVVLILAVTFAVARAKAQSHIRPVLGVLASIATAAATAYLIFLALW